MAETPAFIDEPEAAQPAMRRKQLGRRARRKVKKLQEIESIVRSSRSALGPSTSRDHIPTDREYVWPAVKELSQLSAEDDQALMVQLGYLPGNALQVVSRVCDAFDVNDTSPLVLKLYPLVLRDESNGTKGKRTRKQAKESDSKQPLVEPFPTIFWVTNPHIRALISKLELQQYGIKYEKDLADNKEAQEFMNTAHVNYGKEREKVITKEDWEWIRTRKWEGAFAKTRGVAGIRNPRSVKCLHAHAAHFWSGCTDNVIGGWVAKEVEKMLTKEEEEKVMGSLSKQLVSVGLKECLDQNRVGQTMDNSTKIPEK